ncbi:MAG TPA: hypothetical protein VHP30_12200 [Ignavibacteriales bacterium]|nr:hypothetical protein [Ignavibacteriales bacterium]
MFNKIRLKRIIVFTAFLCLLINTYAQAQEETDAQKTATMSGTESAGTRSYKYRKSADATAAAAKGLAKYLRFSIHDGNLVTGGSANSGLLAYHYISGNPSISWPKGPAASSYLHSAVFYVAAEVVDETGDTIHISSDNYRRSGAEQSPDQSHFYGFMPLPGYFNNHQTNSTEWDMEGISEDVGIDGLPNTSDEGEGDGALQTEEDFNKNGVLDESMINEAGWFAMSNRKDTWPEYWPQGSYPGDTRKEGQTQPDVRAGKWNGEYGAYMRADQESYYVMTDAENDEFKYYPFDDAASRQSWPNGKRGLGLTVEVRNYQWSSRLAEDIWISIYDVTNHGKDLNKCVVGMLVDPDMGGSLSGDDASFDQDEDITYAWNKTGVSDKGLKTGYFGFAFLESPGIPDDGIDNDGDGLVDESQNNDMDEDGDWTIWDDANNNGIWDNEDANNNGALDLGEDINGNGILDVELLNDDTGSDGISPDMEDYTGPDADGTEGNGRPDQGEPNFGFTDNDESDQVGLTSFYLRDVQDVMANDESFWKNEIQPGSFITRPGYQRDISWIYGSGFVKFAGTERTNRYAIALLFGNDKEDILRNKKTMQVIYDEDYNFSKPPRKPLLNASAGDKQVILTWDDAAESSKDPIYGDDFEAYYIYKSVDPNFSDIKTITDGYGNPLLFEPIAIFDKKDGLTGIHPVRIGSEIGPESDLGVSYNMGTDSGLKHYYIDNDVTNGRTYYYAVVSVDKGYMPSFYPDLSDREGLLTISPTECTAIIQTDQLGRAIAVDKNTAIATPMEAPAGWVEPIMNENGIRHVSGNGTGAIKLEVIDPFIIKDNRTYQLKFDDDASYEYMDSVYTGITNRATLVDLSTGASIASIADPDNNEAANEFIAEGFKIIIENDSLGLMSGSWSKGSSNLSFSNTTESLAGFQIPRDYEIRILNPGADTSLNNTDANFQIWDVTDSADSYKMTYRYTDANKDGLLGENDRIILFSKYNSKRLWIWDMKYIPKPDSSVNTPPVMGDIYAVSGRKPFDRNDAFEFKYDGNTVSAEKAKGELNNIYTVPDPYIVVSALERKVINEAEGRGDRRIDFVNLPQQCTISIFTVSGKLVRKLTHSSDSNESRAIWDLRTKDGLEISHGVYFYVVEAPGIGKKTGRLAVIK